MKTRKLRCSGLTHHGLAYEMWWAKGLEKGCLQCEQKSPFDTQLGSCTTGEQGSCSRVVVACGQTCGVPGRYIGENVAFLRDVVDLDIEYNLPVALLSLDQERAFDRVDWLFLFAILTRMGFGDNFIRWLKLLYTDVRSSVLANGYTTRHFKPSRGVRQGCPLSPLLYVLSMAPAIIVRHVLFGFSSDELLCVPLVFCYLLSLLKFFVWCQRKNYRFR